MALTLNPATRVISVPQADLTLVTGTLYSLDTDQFRKDVFDLLSSQPYIWMPDAFAHNTEVTVAGTTFARTLEFINSYSVEFTPDSQWTVRLEGSNNNIFDVESGILVQNQVQVIPTNSAGLISLPQLLDIWRNQGLEVGNPLTITTTTRSTSDSKIDLDITGDGETTSTVTRN